VTAAEARPAPDSGPTRELAFKAVAVKRHYPGVKALDGVDLEGYPGEVLAVCGANGAGKSTFAKLLAGVEPPTDGVINVTGYPHPVRNAAEAEQAGVLMMFQEPLIIDDFTVGENVWLYKLRAGRDIRPGAPKTDTNSERTREVLRGVGLGHLRTNELARDLGPGQRQMLSLSRAAVTEHKIMILDETTASTSEEHFNDILDLVAPGKGRPDAHHVRLAPAQRGVGDGGPDRGAAQRHVGRRGQEVRLERPEDLRRRHHDADDRPRAQGAGSAGTTVDPGCDAGDGGARPARRLGARGVVRRDAGRGRRALRPGG
jgi:ABC-type branched-subunit amino acid transport system ATPase component